MGGEGRGSSRSKGIFTDFIIINFFIISFDFSSYLKEFELKIYKTIIVTIALSDCDTCSVIVREELRIRVFENRKRKIFGIKRDDSGEWRRLDNEKLYSLYRSLKIDTVIKFRTLR